MPNRESVHAFLHCIRCSIAWRLLENRRFMICEPGWRHRTREAWRICSPIPMGRGIVEGCGGERGRGDTMVEGTLVMVLVVGVVCAFGASRCRDFDEARCLCGNIELRAFRLSHCFITDRSSRSSCIVCSFTYSSPRSEWKDSWIRLSCITGDT